MCGWESTRGNGGAHLVPLQFCMKGASGNRAAGCLGQRGPTVFLAALASVKPLWIPSKQFPSSAFCSHFGFIA